jgi:hypothetical protein
MIKFSGTDMAVDPLGEYILYEDHLKVIDYLMDKNFSLQKQCLELNQELTAVGDRVNRMYLLNEEEIYVT